jgi:hypothetical protein
MVHALSMVSSIIMSWRHLHPFIRMLDVLTLIIMAITYLGFILIIPIMSTR